MYEKADLDAMDAAKARGEFLQTYEQLNTHQQQALNILSDSTLTPNQLQFMYQYLVQNGLPTTK